MTHVYLTSEGEYDDYMVTGVFTTREKAKAHCCHGGCPEDAGETWKDGTLKQCRIEEMELDKSA